MANNEETVYSDPNFAIICSFYEQFSELCCLPEISFIELQQKLEDTKNVCPELVDLHVRLLRKAGRKSVTHDKWERAVVKYCHTYSKVDAWEIERFGYKKAKLSVKVNLLKHLLESQFDGNVKFKAEVNKLTSQQLRLLPIGRDMNGQMYWFQLDKEFNVRIYKEDQDDETWELVVKERDDLARLIDHLEDPNSEGKKEESTATSENDDSKDSKEGLAANGKENQKLDTGQDLTLDKKASSNECLEDPERKVIVCNNVSVVKEEKVIDDSSQKIEKVPEDMKPEVKERISITIKKEILEEDKSEFSEEKIEVQNFKIKTEIEDVTEKKVKFETEIKQENEVKPFQIRESVIKTVEKVSDMSLKDKGERIIDFRPSENCYDSLEKATSHYKRDKIELKENEQSMKPRENSEKINEIKVSDETIATKDSSSSIDSKMSPPLPTSKLDSKLLNKDMEGPTNLVKTEMKDKLKSERMIPLKKREVPKEVETEAMSESKLPEPEKKDLVNQTVPLCLEPLKLSCNQREAPPNDSEKSYKVSVPSAITSELPNSSRIQEKKTEQNKEVPIPHFAPESVPKNSSKDACNNDFINKDSFSLKSQSLDLKKDSIHSHELKKDLAHGRSEFSRGSKLSNVLLKLTGKQQTVENENSGLFKKDLSEKNDSSLIGSLIKEKCKQNQDEKNDFALDLSHSKVMTSKASAELTSDPHLEDLKKTPFLNKQHSQPSSDIEMQDKTSSKLNKENQLTKTESSILPSKDEKKSCESKDSVIEANTCIVVSDIQAKEKKDPLIETSKKELEIQSSKCINDIESKSSKLNIEDKKSEISRNLKENGANKSNDKGAEVLELKRNESKKEETRQLLNNKETLLSTVIQKHDKKKSDEFTKSSDTKCSEHSEKHECKKTEEANLCSSDKSNCTVDVSQKSTNKKVDEDKLSEDKNHSSEATEKVEKKKADEKVEKKKADEKVEKKKDDEKEENKKADEKEENKKADKKKEFLSNKDPCDEQQRSKSSKSESEKSSSNADPLENEKCNHTSSVDEVKVDKGAKLKTEDEVVDSEEKSSSKEPTLSSSESSTNETKKIADQEVSEKVVDKKKGRKSDGTKSPKEIKNDIVSEDTPLSERKTRRKSSQSELNKDNKTDNDSLVIDKSSTKADDKKVDTSEQDAEPVIRTRTRSSRLLQGSLKSDQNEAKQSVKDGKAARKDSKSDLETSESEANKSKASKKAEADDNIDEETFEPKQDETNALEISVDANNINSRSERGGRTRGRRRGRAVGGGRRRNRNTRTPNAKSNVNAANLAPAEIPENLIEESSHEVNNQKLSTSSPATRGRGRGGRRKRGFSAVESSCDDSTPVKRSQRLQAQRQKFLEEQRMREEERKLLAEIKRQEKEEEKRRRQERKDQKASKENGQVKRGRGRPKKGSQVKSVEIPEEEEEEEEEVIDDEDSKESKESKKKRKRKRRRNRGRRRGNNPWDYSSESSSSESSEIENEDEEEQEEEEEELIFNDKSDHEFSPESESECDEAQLTKIKRARTARKVKSESDETEEEEEVVNDDKPCSKCGNFDHPEWILLCDKCDAGYHTACLRPALMLIPDGSWFCPPCEHTSLLLALQEQLKLLDHSLKKKEREELRKKRLAYVGINLDNVLKPEKKEVSDEAEEEEEDLYPKRSCRSRREISYRFKEFDELIESAIQDEVFEEKVAGFGRGKDMSNITEAEGKIYDDNDDDDYEDDKRRGRRKHRRLNDLDSASEDDDGSDEDFKGSSGNGTEPSEEEEVVSTDDSNASWHIRKHRRQPSRRSSRNRRRKGYNDDFVVDDDYESDESDYKRSSRRAASKYISYRELSDSDDDDRWGNKKKVTKKKRRIDSEEESEESDWRSSKSSRSRIKRRWSSDSESDERSPVRSTRGKKVNFKETDSSDSEEVVKKKKRLRIKDFEDDSEDDEEEKVKVEKKEKVEKEVNEDEEEEDDDDDDDDEEEDDEEQDEEEEEEEEEEDEEEGDSDNSEEKEVAEKDVKKDIEKIQNDSNDNQRSVIKSVESVKKELLKGSEECKAEKSSEKENTSVKVPKDNLGPNSESSTLPSSEFSNKPEPKASALEQSHPPPAHHPPSHLAMLESFPPPAVHSYDPPKVDHPPPHYLGEYHPPPPPYSGQYYSHNYRPPEEEFSHSGYVPPPPPGASQNPTSYSPYHPPSPPSYGFSGQPYSQDGQLPNQPYGDYEGYGTPENQQSPNHSSQNGNYSISNLLQRRTDAAGEEDDFNVVSDLVSYITGSHESQL